MDMGLPIQTVLWRRVMFVEVEKQAIFLILGMGGEPPKTLGEVARQLFPDLADSSAPSRDKRVISLTQILRQRSGTGRYTSTSSRYYTFYLRKKRDQEIGSAYSPGDVAFLEKVYRACPSWHALMQKIIEVVRGPSLRMMHGEKVAPQDRSSS